MKLFGWLIPWWAYGIAAALLALAVWQLSAPIRAVFDWFSDREAVSQDRAERRAKVTETVLVSEREANRRGEVRRVERERQDEQLDTAIEAAVVENPDETNLPAGPAVRAVLRELREQAAGNSDPAAGEI